MIKKLFASLLAAFFLVGMSFTLVGCNTMEGVGKDIEAGGKAVKNEARKSRGY